MANNPIKYSIIIPTKNEKNLVKNTLHKAIVIKKHLPHTEFIIVNDFGKSKLHTKKLKHIIPHIKYINNTTIPGKGAAVRLGALHSRGQYLIFIDADNDIDPNILQYLINSIKKGNTHIVYANKFNPQSTLNHGLIRKLGSIFIAKIVRLIFPNLLIKDTQTGAKAFTRHAWQTIQRNLVLELTGFSYEIEHAFIASCMELTIKEIPVNINRDNPSSITIQLKRAFSIIVDAIHLKLATLNRCPRTKQSNPN